MFDRDDVAPKVRACIGAEDEAEIRDRLETMHAGSSVTFAGPSGVVTIDRTGDDEYRGNLLAPETPVVVNPISRGPAEQ